MDKLFLLTGVWFPLYEGDDPAPDPGDDPPKDDPPVDPNKKTFTQDDVNKILAADRRKHKGDLQKAIDELEAVKVKADLTSKERSDLEERLDDLKGQLLTKEELAEKEKQKTNKRHAEEVGKLTGEVDLWRTRYTKSSIDRAITDASSKHKAFSGEQIIAILGPKTQMVEEVNKEGEKTGNLVPRVQFPDSDKDGKPVTLDLAVDDAVKRMTEMDAYQNLFQAEGSGGLGATNRGGAKPEDMSTLLKDPRKYREARKSGKISFQ